MPDRIFLTWAEPFLPEAARHLAEAFKTTDAISLAEATLVVPGARGGRRLLELLVEEAERLNLPLRPPAAIVTPGSVPELLYRADLPLANRPEARRAWARALDLVPSRVTEIVFPRRAAGGGPSARAALARVLEELNRETGGAGLSFHDVAGACERIRHFSDRDRWSALATLQDAYVEILEASFRRDREWARRRAIANGHLEARNRLVLLGVAEMPGVVRQMLEMVRPSVTAYVHAPPELAGNFHTLGTQRTEIWREWSVSIPDEILEIADRPPDQASVALEVLGRLGGRFSLEEITLGVPNEEVVPLLQQRLAAAGVRHRYAEGEPLSRTGPFRLLEAIADYLEDQRFDALAALVRHPEITAYLGDDSLPAQADEFHAQHLPQRLPPSSSPMGKGRGLGAALERLWGPELLGALGGTRPLGAWMPEIMGLLARVLGRRSRDPAVAEDRRVIESAVRIREVAELLFDVPEALDEPGDACTAIRLLLLESREEKLPPDAEESALEMVGWLELHLDDAPVVLLTGVNEPFLSRSVNGDVFLPNGLRRLIGIEDNERRLARDAYRLSAILASRPTGQVIIVAGRRTASGDPLRPSRLLFRDAGEIVARRVLRITAERNGEGREKGALSHPGVSSGATGFTLPPEPRIPVPQLPSRIPVTDFGRLLSDPYLWGLERQLGLREAGDEEPEMDPLVFGGVAHRVLELFGRTEESTDVDPVRVADRLSKILDDVARQRFGSFCLPTVPIQLEQLRHRLSRFARWQADWVARGWRIFATEAETPPEGVPLYVDGAPVFLTGRIDRIDRNLETGEWAVLDYKTGDRRRKPEQTHGAPGGWKDLQLPLYRHLLGSLRDSRGGPLKGPEGEETVALGYLCISRETESEILCLAPWGPAEVEDGVERAREVIRHLRQERAVNFVPGESGRTAKGAMAALLGQGILAFDEGDEEGALP